MKEKISVRTKFILKSLVPFFLVLIIVCGFLVTAFSNDPIEGFAGGIVPICGFLLAVKGFISTVVEVFDMGMRKCGTITKTVKQKLYKAIGNVDTEKYLDDVRLGRYGESAIYDLMADIQEDLISLGVYDEEKDRAEVNSDGNLVPLYGNRILYDVYLAKHGLLSMDDMIKNRPYYVVNQYTRQRYGKYGVSFFGGWQFEDFDSYKRVALWLEDTMKKKHPGFGKDMKLLFIVKDPEGRIKSYGCPATEAVELPQFQIMYFIWSFYEHGAFIVSTPYEMAEAIESERRAAAYRNLV